MTHELIPKARWPLVSKWPTTTRRERKKNYNKAGLGSTSCASPLVLGLDIWPPPQQESARLVFHPISWRQLNNTYIRARLHTHTSCTCARTCIRTTYSYRHAQSGIKNDHPARAKLVKQPPAQRHRQTRAPICSKSPGYSCSCLCGPFFSLFMLVKSLGMSTAAGLFGCCSFSGRIQHTLHTHGGTECCGLTAIHLQTLAVHIHMLFRTYRQNIHAAIACYMSRPQRLDYSMPRPCLRVVQQQHPANVNRRTQDGSQWSVLTCCLKPHEGHAMRQWEEKDPIPLDIQ